MLQVRMQGTILPSPPCEGRLRRSWTERAGSFMTSSLDKKCELQDVMRRWNSWCKQTAQTSRLWFFSKKICQSQLKWILIVTRTSSDYALCPPSHCPSCYRMLKVKSWYCCDQGAVVTSGDQVWCLVSQCTPLITSQHHHGEAGGLESHSRTREE